MGAKTKIEWTATEGQAGATWNCVRGCSREMAEGATQSGCGDATGGGCYAERDGGRFCGPGLPYEGLVRLTATGPRWTGDVAIIGKKLLDPLRWRSPRGIFVASVSDPFHPKLSNENIAGLYGIMVLAWQHKFQLLTKRARRMRSWYEWAAKLTVPDLIAFTAQLVEQNSPIPGSDMKMLRKYDGMLSSYSWPLSNLWVGVSTEHQAAADDRIPHLLSIPAQVRWISAEPLIGPIDLRRLQHAREFEIDALTGDHGVTRPLAGRSERRLSWVVSGCESGPRARDCDPAWLRNLRDQCAETGVPYFIKQAKAWDHGKAGIVPFGIGVGPGSHVKRDGVIGAPYLDGRQHLEYPK